MDKLAFEKALWSKGYQMVAGVDEAGRGPLAGPVIAAACILDPNTPIIGLNDSKKLSAKKRELLFDEIKEKALAWSIKAASVEDIFRYNILGATKRAMHEAILALEPQADAVLLDAVRLDELELYQEELIKGDAISDSIAAASILAKVSRDRHMEKVDEVYPQYAFAKHKGYGTAAHYKALDEHGPCPEHRSLFLRSWLARQDKK